MKKLMIAAASAAVGLGAFANEYIPEAYEMNITVKTTTCKEGQNKTLEAACDETTYTYRAKATQKIAGLFWGCDCPTISEPKAFETFDDFGKTGESHGYVFWDASVKTKDPYETAEFNWSDGEYDNFLQYFGNSAKDVEGLWTLALTDSDGKTVVKLQGAGVGSAKFNKSYLVSYVNSMSGNVTGWAFPGYLSYGCAACGGQDVGCSAWQFCADCEERDQDYPSAAYGTWTLKFSSSVAKKYGNGTTRTSILSAYKFSDAVKAYLVEVDEGYEPEERTDAEKTYDAAKAAYEAGVAVNEGLLAKIEAAKIAQTNGVAIAAVSNTVVAAEKKMLATKKAFLENTDPVQKQIGADWGDEIASYWAAAEAYLSLWANNGYSNSVAAVSAALNDMEVAKNTLESGIDQDQDIGASARVTFKANCANLYADAKAFAETTYGVAILKYEELTISHWTFSDVTAELDKAVDDAQANYLKNKVDTDDLKTKMDTAKIICDATGGDCD